MTYLLDTNVCITLLRGKDAMLLQRASARETIGNRFVLRGNG